MLFVSNRIFILMIVKQYVFSSETIHMHVFSITLIFLVFVFSILKKINRDISLILKTWIDMSKQTLQILFLLRLCNSLSPVYLSSETHNRLLHRKIDKSTVRILHPQAIMFLAQDIIRYIKLEICYKGPRKRNGSR